MDEIHCVTEWGSSSNNKNRSAFSVWYFRDSRNFNYAILTAGIYVISMEFLAVSRRCLSSRFARSSGGE